MAVIHTDECSCCGGHRNLPMPCVCEVTGPRGHWLVEDLVPVRSSSILVGRPELEPRAAARELAIAVACGRPWMGRETQRGPVLWVRIEDEKYETSDPEPFDCEGVHVHVCAPSFVLLEDVHRTARALGAFLVVVDGLVPMIAAEEENDDHVHMSALDRILDRGGHERAFVLLHEQRRPHEMGAILASTNRTPDLLLTARGRDGERVWLEALDAEGGTARLEMRLPSGSCDDAEYREQILEVLRRESRLMSIQELQGALPGNPRRLHRQLGVLKEQRRVIEIADPGHGARRLFTGCNPVYQRYGSSWLMRVEPWAKLERGSRSALGPHVRA